MRTPYPHPTPTPTLPLLPHTLYPPFSPSPFLPSLWHKCRRGRYYRHYLALPVWLVWLTHCSYYRACLTLPPPQLPCYYPHPPSLPTFCYLVPFGAVLAPCHSPYLLLFHYLVPTYHHLPVGDSFPFLLVLDITCAVMLDNIFITTYLPCPTRFLVPVGIVSLNFVVALPCTLQRLVNALFLFGHLRFAVRLFVVRAPCMALCIFAAFITVWRLVPLRVR